MPTYRYRQEGSKWRPRGCVGGWAASYGELCLGGAGWHMNACMCGPACLRLLCVAVCVCVGGGLCVCVCVCVCLCLCLYVHVSVCKYMHACGSLRASKCMCGPVHHVSAHMHMWACERASECMHASCECMPHVSTCIMRASAYMHHVSECMHASYECLWACAHVSACVPHVIAHTCGHVCLNVHVSACMHV